MTGAWHLLRFMLRRERVALPIWVFATAAFVGIQSLQSQDFYSDPEQLAALRRTAEGNASLVAMAGPTHLIQSVGGEAVFEVFSFAAVVVVLMTMFLLTRHTRADEETGRAELVRSTRVGRRAPLTAAVALVVIANLAVGVAVAATAMATGLPVAGSVLLGAALGGVGLSFAGITAVVVQLTSSARGAYAVVVALLGVAFGLRAIGDVGDGRLSWLSPIGWGQRTYPFADDQWWPLLLPLAVGVAGVGAAVAVLERRDLGAGVFAERPGRARASWVLRDPLGLAWRLQRGALAGWSVGVFTLGLVYGGFGDSMEQFVADNPDIAEFLPGGAQSVLDSYFAITLTMGAILATAYGVGTVLRGRGEEAAGRVESLLATATSRWAWLGSHLAVALGGSVAVLAASGLGNGLGFALTGGPTGDIGRLLGLSLVYAPGVWVGAGLAAAIVGFLPRAASPVAWALVALIVVVAFFGDSFELPQWLQALSPLENTPQVPFEPPRWAPLLVLAALAGSLLATGLAAFHRRDLTTS